MTFKEVKEIFGDTWNYEKVGDQIEGILLAKKTNVGKNQANLYDIEVSEGVVKSVWGSVVIDDRMRLVSVGDRIRLTYLGMEKNYHHFKLERDENEEQVD